MRISGGTFKGHTLIVPKGDGVRPTTDKVRQAIFNALNSRGFIAGAQVLDLFCGTGALGLEALSRGAAHAMFVDNAQAALKACRTNIHHCGAQDNAVVLNKDVLKLHYNKGPKADLVLLDPPYRHNLVFPALQYLAAQGWVAGGAAVVIDCEKGADENLPSGYELLDVKNHGDVKVLLAQYAGIDQGE